MEGNKRFTLVAAVFMALALPPSLQAKIIYVDGDANGLNNGSSWSDAYTFLQDALKEISYGGKATEIRVAEGVYRPDRSSAHPNGTRDHDMSFYLLTDIPIRGGFAGFGSPDPNARDVERYTTVLSGDLAGNDAEVANALGLTDDPTRADNAYHVVTNCNLKVKGSLDESGSLGDLDGFTITGGYASVSKYATSSGVWDGHPGGGLYIGYYSVPPKVATVRNCVIAGNYAPRGGGAGCMYGYLSFVNCRFAGNHAGENGGGVYALKSNVQFTDCRFEDNVGGEGGGVWSESTSLGFVACVLARNQAVIGDGGAIVATLGNPGTATMECQNCRFVSNRAAENGGAILNLADTTVGGCCFGGNVAGGFGGAIWERGRPLRLVNCTACGNLASDGRLLYSSDWRDTHAPPRSYASVRNCIVSDGPNEVRNDNGSIITIEYSDVVGGRAAIGPNVSVTWGEGNIDADPCFVKPGYWDPNGTPGDPNDDIFIEGDYHLKSQAGRWDANSQTWVADGVTSPCIDAGDPNTAVADEPQPNGGRINMGAYGGTAEASKSYSLGSPIVFFGGDAWQRE